MADVARAWRGLCLGPLGQIWDLSHFRNTIFICQILLFKQKWLHNCPNHTFCQIGSLGFRIPWPQFDGDFLWAWWPQYRRLGL